MFTAGVPERIIQERTGHRSIDALRLYKRTSESQQQAVSNVLASHTATSYTVTATQQQPPQPDVSCHTFTPQVPVQNFYSYSVNMYNAPVTQFSGIRTQCQSTLTQVQQLDILDGLDLDTILAD